MPRRCPECGQEWEGTPTFCGACGAHLDPTPRPSTGRSGALSARRGRLVGLALVVAVGLGVLLVRATRDVPAARPDDTVALPTASPDATVASPTGPTAVRCTQARVPVDCLAWEVDADHEISLGPRLPDAGILVDTAAGTLTARDATTGRVVWQREDLDQARPQAVVGGVLVLARSDGAVAALDAATGVDLWAREGLVPVSQDIARLDPGVVVAGRRPADGTNPSSMVGLDPRTGDERWEWTTPWAAGIETSVQAVAPDGLLVTGSRRLARVDAATGRTAWVVDTLADAYLQPHASGHVSAQQLGTRASPQLWLHDLGTGEVVLRTPATRVVSHQVVDDVVVVNAPAEGVLRGMELSTGEVRWRHVVDTSAALGFPYAPADPTAVVVLEREANRVLRLDPTTGEPVWEAELPAPRPPSGSGTYFGQPMLVGDTVVVEDTSSAITVLDAATGRERLRVVGDPALDVRSLDPLTLVQGQQWVGIDVPPADPAGQ